MMLEYAADHAFVHPQAYKRRRYVAAVSGARRHLALLGSAISYSLTALPRFLYSHNMSIRTVGRSPGQDKPLRRTLDAAEPARYTLLGLLLGGPHHGYDLARHFGPTSALGDVIHLSASHLYALLTRLEQDGLIVGERQESGAHPPRRVYRLTEDGRTAVLRWIDEPVARPRDVLLDFPLKLYLARRQDPRRAAALIARQRDLFVSYLLRLEAAESAPDTEDGAFTALMRKGRIARTHAALTWLDQCADTVSAPTDVSAP